MRAWRLPSARSRGMCRGRVDAAPAPAEVLLGDRAGDRGRRLDAEPTALHRHGDHDLRVWIRSDDAVPGLVLLALSLGGASLARDRDGEAAHHRIRGAAGFVRGAMQALEDHVPRLIGDAEVALWRRVDLPDGLALDVHDASTDVWPHEAAAVRQRGVGPGQLEGRDHDVALADGEVHVVALVPGPIDVGVLVAPEDAVPPRRRGDQAGGGIRHVDRRLAAQAVLECPVLDLAAVATRGWM